jgi:nucleotide-binding universal stress UspA family protein
VGRTWEVVVGIDGSPGSSAAVQWAAHAAAHQAGVLAIVHVADASGGLWSQSQAVRSELRELTRPLLDIAREVAACAEPTVPIRSEVLLGPPWRQLATLSARADLLVVGRSGRSRGLGAILGSTPIRLAARTECPLAIVPIATAWPPERVVVGVGALPADRGLLHVGSDVAASLAVPAVQVHVRAQDDALPQPSDTLVLTGRPDRELAQFCTAGDLLLVGRRPARVAVVQEARYRLILDRARCPVVLVPLGRAVALTAVTTGERAGGVTAHAEASMEEVNS